MGRKRDIQIADMVGKPIAEKMEQVEAAVRRDGEQTRAAYTKQIGEIKEVVDIAIADLSSREKKELYDLNTSVDIAELDNTEKEFLMAVLYTLAGMTEEVTEAQQGYLRSVKRYLDVKNVQTMVDLSKIENIDSKREEKAILQCVMEFLFLENCNHDYWDEYEDVLDYFSVRNSEIRKMEAAINNIYRATGSEGLAEKFGYVPELELDEQTEPEQLAEGIVDYSIPADIADLIQFEPYVQSNRYVVFSKRNDDWVYVFYVWDKITKQMHLAQQLNSKDKPECMGLDGDNLYVKYGNGEGIVKCCIVTEKKTNICGNVSSYKHEFSVKNNRIAYLTNNDQLMLLDISSGKQIAVAEDIEKFLLTDKKLFIAEYSKLVEFDIGSNERKEIFSKDWIHIQQILHMGQSVFIMYDEDNIVKILEISDNGTELQQTEHCSMRLTSTYWLGDHAPRFPYFVIVKPEYDFPVYSFNVISKELQKVATGCGHVFREKGSLFKKATSTDIVGDFQVVGSFIYFSEDHGICRRSLVHRVDLAQNNEHTEVDTSEERMEMLLKQLLEA